MLVKAESSHQNSQAITDGYGEIQHKTDAHHVFSTSMLHHFFQEFIWPVFFICLLAAIKQLSTPDIDTSSIRDYPINDLKYGNGPQDRPLILVAPNTSMKAMYISSEAIKLLQPVYNNSKVMIPLESKVS